MFPKSPICLAVRRKKLNTCDEAAIGALDYHISFAVVLRVSGPIDHPLLHSRQQIPGQLCIKRVARVHNQGLMHIAPVPLKIRVHAWKRTLHGQFVACYGDSADSGSTRRERMFTAPERVAEIRSTWSSLVSVKISIT